MARTGAVVGEREKTRAAVERTAKRFLDHERRNGNSSYTYEKAHRDAAKVARDTEARGTKKKDR